MLHAWNLIALAFCASLATLALARGQAEFLAMPGVLGKMEGAALTLAGVAGWVGILILHGGTP